MSTQSSYASCARNTKKDTLCQEANSTPKRKRRRKQKDDNNCITPIPQFTPSPALHDGESQVKHLLICGYIRTYFINKNNYYFPNDLIKSILLFYDEIIYWIIGNKSILKFKSMKNGKALYGSKFNLINYKNPLIIETTLCGNGWKSNQIGSVQFYLEIRRLPSLIKKVYIYYELYCKQTSSMCKKLRMFKSINDAQSWGTNNMKLNECKGFNQLQFSSFCRIIRIIPHKNDIYIEPITINKTTSYEWKINDKLFDKFKKAHKGKFFYSDNFGKDSFCFEFAPNGWHSSHEQVPMLYLRLLKLPLKVKKIITKCYFNNEIIKHTFSYNVHGLHLPLNIILNDIKYNNFKFKIKMNIIKAIDINDKQIPSDKWADFDIIM